MDMRSQMRSAARHTTHAATRSRPQSKVAHSLFMVSTIVTAIDRIPAIERHKLPDLKGMLVSAAPISGETALKPTRSSVTPCIRGTGRPRYYLLR